MIQLTNDRVSLLAVLLNAYLPTVSGLMQASSSARALLKDNSESLAVYLPESLTQIQSSYRQEEAWQELVRSVWEAV